MAALQSGKKVIKDMNIFEALNASMANIEQTLKHMKLPINQTKHAQESLEADLKAYLKNLYDNIKKCIATGNLTNDPVGLLSNDFILANNSAAKKAYPHHVLLPALITQIIAEDKEPLMSRPTAKQKQAKNAAAKAAENVQPTTAEIVLAVAEAKESNAVTVEGLSELDATSPVQEINPQTNSVNPMTTVTITPAVQTQLNATAAAIATHDHTPAGATETVAIPVDYNHSFHIPHMTKVEGILLTMNDAIEEEEIKSLRSQLTQIVREWVDSFYKSLHDIENPNRVTIDSVGILTHTTKYSQPEMHAKYDNAHMVDKIIAKVSEKYKKTNTEASVHAMATALSGAQDDTQKTFQVKTAPGEVITVDKETGNIVTTKDGKIVSFLKGVYKGVKKFFKNIWSQMRRFGAWIKSWFTGGKEEKVIVTPEQALVMEAAAESRAKALASQSITA